MTSAITFWNHHLETVVNMLLQAGADPNIQDVNGDTVLMMISRSILPVSSDIVETLLEAGADPYKKIKKVKQL